MRFHNELYETVVYLPGKPRSPRAVQETLGGLPFLPYVTVVRFVLQCSILQALHLLHLSHLPRHVDLLLEHPAIRCLEAGPLLRCRLARLIALRPEAIDWLPQMQLDLALVAIVEWLYLRICNYR